jgi:hypothetical protein
MIDAVKLKPGSSARRARALVDVTVCAVEARMA